MRRVFSVILVTSLVTVFGQAEVWAQGGIVAASVPSVDAEAAGPDTGGITSSAADPGFVKAWVSRSSTGATAISIYNDGLTLSAKFRRFSKTEEQYSSKITKILTPPTPTGPATTIAEIETVTVRLVALPGSDDTYKMVYDSVSPASEVDVGYVRFGRGNNQRRSSDVIVRFQNIEGVIDPCSKPPIDDIGEEEQMPAGATANAPGPSLSLTAPIAP
jgi:hypothetical protein